MTKNGAVHLVGSVPLGSVQEVFSVCCHELGDVCSRLPDGEAGGWVNIPAATLGKANGLELISSTLIEGTGHEVKIFRLKHGVSGADVVFAPTGYVEIAKRSYEEFKQARAAAKILPGTRFQVSLPTAFATLALSVMPEDLPAVYQGFEAHVLREVQQICAAIPHQELAIQWDVAVEVISVLERQTPAVAELFSVNDIAQMLERACNCVPKGVEVGMHLCYGNPGGKHIMEPADLSKLVDFSNRLFPLLERQLNWLHMPVPIARADDAYFAALQQLKLPQNTEFYLGLVHPGDGIEGARRRIAAGKKFMPKFGVATECGLRFFPPHSIASLLSLHRAAATLAS
jgi:methionine synthase II (cobalamin-independent)